MKRLSFAHWPCSIARTADIVGDSWTLLVLREAFYGIHRFDQIQRALGIPRNTLTERLGKLLEEGLLIKRAYTDEPKRYEYVLTEKGRDFFGVIAAITRWGDRWLAGEEGAPITLHHESCGHDTHAEVVCAECGHSLRAEETTMHTGPGYPEQLARHPEVRRRFEPDHEA
ncbi:winged helix-turn-helix transcriptional regulator [Nocardia sp. bgisy134]|uniref:winged helix-turn-helix transcriptional regulator n=1 Tax=unclassified Nocardia TaxID=2637762 RepID=UPI003D753C97